MAKSEYKYTKEVLQEAINSSQSFSDVCRFFGKAPRGAVYLHIQSRIRKFCLNTDHFLGKSAKAGARNPGRSRKLLPSEILVTGYTFRAPTFQLRRAMIESGILYECSECGIKHWRGVNIVLHIDHINGDWTDCRIENVRFLCPNCHSLTPTFGNRVVS